jgi:hypothetical protein
MVLIESIEDRTLFTANVSDAIIARAEASGDSIVQGTLDLVKAGLRAIDEARGGQARAKLRQIADTGLAQLARARDAVRAVRQGDSAVREMAIETLKAARRELKANVAAAKLDVRTSVVENQTDLQQATSSLRQHFKMLRFALRFSNVPISPMREGGSALTTTQTVVTTHYDNGDFLGGGIKSSTVATDFNFLPAVSYSGNLDAAYNTFEAV